MGYENLTPEQKERAKSCKTPEEMLALAKEEGYELSDSDLEGISGGWDICEGASCAYYCAGRGPLV